MSTDFPLRNTGAPDEPVENSVDVENAVDAEETFDDDGVLYDDEVTPEYGILGFTLRELLITGVWLLLFVVSFFPLGWTHAIWGQGISWLLPIGVPTVAVFLIVLRRFSPDGIRRVGSLGIDQFASVAFSVAAVWWAQQLWEYVALLLTAGLGAVVWVPWVSFVLSLALVVLTVFAPLVPGLKDDFHGRLVTLAHRNANPVRPVIARPRPEPAVSAQGHASSDGAEPGLSEARTGEAFAAPDPTGDHARVLDVELSGQQTTDEVSRIDVAGHVPLSAHASGGGTGTAEATSDEQYVPSYSRRSRGEEIVSDTASIEELILPAISEPEDRDTAADEQLDAAVDIEATNPREQAVEQAQPFWILASTERDVHDERGEPIFRIGPSAWALVIEDRGGAYVVRHDDGRIGYLHDISDITKG